MANQRLSSVNPGAVIKPASESPDLLNQDKWRITRSVLLVLLCSAGAASLSVHWLTPIV